MTAPILTTAEVGAALPVWMTAAEAGKLIGVKAHTVQDAAWKGQLVRRGKRYTTRPYHYLDVFRWLESRGQLDPRWEAMLK